ncbi:MAG: ArsR/SmtB family transcription factor [Candidatus Sigynarchaeota archaeon]
MDKELENLIKEIPDTIISAIKALQNPRRFSIAILLEKGKQSLTYLGNATQSENGALVPQLLQLEDAGILYNQWHDQKRASLSITPDADGDKKTHPSGTYSMYELTPFGKQLIEVIATSGSTARLPMLKALANPLRFGLVRYMIARGSLSFSRVAAITDLEKSAVASHLGKLEAGGLLTKSFSRNKVSGEYSVYSTTRIAAEVIPRLLLLEQYRVLSTSTMNLMKQEQALAALRAAMEGIGATSDLDFCRQVLDLERTHVAALLAAGSPEEKRTHAKQLAITCDALKKFAESFLTQ